LRRPVRNPIGGAVLAIAGDAGAVKFEPAQIEGAPENRYYPHLERKRSEQLADRRTNKSAARK